MSNMSYCRFENTSNDIKDCLEALRDGVSFEALSSEYERSGFKNFLRYCLEVADHVKENHEDLSNEDAIDQFIEDECRNEYDEEEDE